MEFPTTRWTWISQLRSADPIEARDALERVCRHYERPILAFVRRQGWGEDSEDLVQDFFLRKVIEEGVLEKADRTVGRLRNYLLGILKNLLRNERERRLAERRGGRSTRVHIDPDQAREEIRALVRRPMTPEEVWHSQWARQTVESAVERVREEYRQAGRVDLFDALLPNFLDPVKRPGYTAIREQFAMSAGAARTAAYRLRNRLLEVLRETVAETVEDPAEIDDELRELLKVFRR